MKIRVNVPVATVAQCFVPGQEYDMDDSEADLLITAGRRPPSIRLPAEAEDRPDDDGQAGQPTMSFPVPRHRPFASHYGPGDNTSGSSPGDCDSGSGTS